MLFSSCLSVDQLIKSIVHNLKQFDWSKVFSCDNLIHRKEPEKHCVRIYFKPIRKHGRYRDTFHHIQRMHYSYS